MGAGKSLLVGGSASSVGKSWMTAAVCRHLRRRGLRVAPFKAQNMSNNSYPCAAGGEIGRAQAAQAEAAGVEPHPDMNPVLLKPTSDTTSQVVVHGRPWRDLSGKEYYAQTEFLRERIAESFERLLAEYDVVVAEGAGGLAEINLRSVDMVNFGLAGPFQTPVLLVADIDRGGVFPAVWGTLGLLDPADRALVRSFAVNRFRGDPELFAEGKRMLEQKAETPCLGVFPFAPDIHLDEEDGPLQFRPSESRGARPRVGIIRFPRISNLTDFRLLPWAEWIDRPPEGEFDAVILPGSKNTIEDLGWMRERSLEEWVRKQEQSGATVLGVCAGYQMLGERIDDPDGVEAGGSAEGLGLLPVLTTLKREKTTRAVQASLLNGYSFGAYEIHMGVTTRPADAAPAAVVSGLPEGLQCGRVRGTYLHGALEDPRVVEAWLGFRPPEIMSKETSYDQLADWFEASADLDLFAESYL